MQFFGRCYELCTELNDAVALHEARVQYGIARGHQLFQDYSSSVLSGADNVQELIAWKDDRATTSAESTEATDDREEEQLDPISGPVKDAQPTTK